MKASFVYQIQRSPRVGVLYARFPSQEAAELAAAALEVSEESRNFKRPPVVRDFGPGDPLADFCPDRPDSWFFTYVENGDWPAWAK